MADIEHVIVLALENRSFDHMLGFLRHPDPEGFAGPALEEHANPGWNGAPPSVRATDAAKRVLPVDPDHSHSSVMEQLAVEQADGGPRPRNLGFVTSYERKARGLTLPKYGGLLGPIVNWFTGRHHPKPIENRGPLIMLCQPPDHVPVLSTLATEFAVCTRWFCSVPGETWPNRNYMHAATSDGETDIDTRVYDDPTIFELLEKHGRTWHIYHGGVPQAWAFPRLWDTPKRHARWFPFSEFARHVEEDRLPNYSFIEPDHNIPLDGVPKSDSNSQHPGNSKVGNDEYDDYPDDEVNDFVRGEALIARIYESLRGRPEVFERSVLLITYDEHGGFYDHVPPPVDAVPPGDRKSRLGALLHVFLRKRSRAFDFTMLGPRVPAVVVSPYVAKGKIDNERHDHASIPATLRQLFAPDAAPLTCRDRHAARFDTVLTLEKPRRDRELPDLSAHTAAAMGPAQAANVPAHAKEFTAQARLVRRRLRRVGEPEVRTAPDVSRAFAEAARRHREELPTER
ncbi:MAG TPA: alkaline phosphatase family protein [Streptosporangiaceae bacterium]|jgi:phospholipase C